MREAEDNESNPDVVLAAPAQSPNLLGRTRLLVAHARVIVGRSGWIVWVFGIVVLGIVWWYAKRRHWLAHFRGWLDTGLQFVVDPSHLAEVLLGVGIVVVSALWLLPQWQAAGSQGSSSENRFDRENEARKTLAQIVAGIFVLAGLYSSVKTFDLQRQTENLQQEGQITDRFTKAIDQLGALAPGGAVDAGGRPKINMEVRLGGIYALERIAKDSTKDHGQLWRY